MGGCGSLPMAASLVLLMQCGPCCGGDTWVFGKCNLHDIFGHDLESAPYDHAGGRWQPVVASWVSPSWSACVNNLEGRLWTVWARIAPNISQLCPGCTGAALVESRFVAELLLERNRGWWTSPEDPAATSLLGLCVPRVCSETIVRSVVVPMLWVMESFRATLSDARRLASRIRRHLSFLSVEELADWSDYDVSWAVIGFPGCGTSSFAANLALHPSLEVIWDETEFMESDFFHFDFYHRQRGSFVPIQPHQYPTRASVSIINRWAAKGRQQKRLRGVKNPIYSLWSVILDRLVQVPRLRVLFLIHDPVALAEREYLKSFWSCDSAEVPVPSLQKCTVSPCRCHCNCTGEWFHAANESRAMSFYIDRARSRFGSDRVFVASRWHLTRGESFYGRVAAFLGVANFEQMWMRKNQAIASQSAESLRQRMYSSSPDAGQQHAQGLIDCHRHFAEERKALRRQVLELPPHWSVYELPPWLLEGSREDSR